MTSSTNLKAMPVSTMMVPVLCGSAYKNKGIQLLLDAIVDYYYTSGVLESESDEVDIDMDAVAEYVCNLAKESNVSQSFDPADVVLMVEADLDFQEQNLT